WSPIVEYRLNCAIKERRYFMKSYVLLSISIIGEVIGTTMLKMAEGFTILGPSIGVVTGYVLSFYLLSLSLKSIPLSLAYAIWSGCGTALAAIVGIIFWVEALSLLKFIGIIFIIGGIFSLNTANKGPQPATED